MGQTETYQHAHPAKERGRTQKRDTNYCSLSSSQSLFSVHLFFIPLPLFILLLPIPLFHYPDGEKNTLKIIWGGRQVLADHIDEEAPSKKARHKNMTERSPRKKVEKNLQSNLKIRGVTLKDTLEKWSHGAARASAYAQPTANRAWIFTLPCGFRRDMSLLKCSAAFSGCHRRWPRWEWTDKATARETRRIKRRVTFLQC